MSMCNVISDIFPLFLEYKSTDFIIINAILNSKQSDHLKNNTMV